MKNLYVVSLRISNHLLAIFILMISKDLVKFSQIKRQFIHFYVFIKIHSIKFISILHMSLWHFEFLSFIHFRNFSNFHCHLSRLIMFDTGFIRHLMVQYCLLGDFDFGLSSIRLLIVLIVDRLLKFIDRSSFYVNFYSFYIKINFIQLLIRRYLLFFN